MFLNIGTWLGQDLTTAISCRNKMLELQDAIAATVFLSVDNDLAAEKKNDKNLGKGLSLGSLKHFIRKRARDDSYAERCAKRKVSETKSKKMEALGLESKEKWTEATVDQYISNCKLESAKWVEGEYGRSHTICNPFVFLPLFSLSNDVTTFPFTFVFVA